ncbi:MAG TPA: PorP/SprF family type IX secretion system membrane protein [Flavisolibacter sp.]|nr:PorP/SprF family type IX secretion system membrane protein [Flavisolibacter sp.]
MKQDLVIRPKRSERRNAMKTFVTHHALFILLTAYCLLPTLVKAQDINFSQFPELPLLRNPALAGLFQGDVKATAVFRNQWSSVTVPYKTRGLSVEANLIKNGNVMVAGGLQVLSDAAGDARLSRTMVMATGAIHVDLGTGYLAAGFSGGTVLQNFDNSGLRWDDQYVNGSYSPTNPTGQSFNGAFPTSRNYGDMAVGLTWSTELENGMRLYVGGAGFHLSKPSRTFSNAQDSGQVKWVANGGLSIPHGDYNRVVFYTDVFTQGGARQFQGGLLYKFNFVQEDADRDLGVNLSLGAFTRWGDAVIPMAKLEYYKLAVGLTYDVNVSKLNAYSTGRGGFEVTAGYRYFNENKAGIKCPRF